MTNEELKSLIKVHRLFQYEIADELGISEGRLSTLLRRPLAKETEERIRAAIIRLAESSTTKEEHQ